MQKCGLFFGSFNPVHCGHLNLANYFTKNQIVDELWFVVSPHNPLKSKIELAKPYLRLEMVKLAVEKYPDISVCDVEFGFNNPSYTINTVDLLTEKFPELDFYIIAGTDLIPEITRWKEYKRLVKEFKFLFYPRMNEADPDISIFKNAKIHNAPIMKLSSTFIREMVYNKENISGIVPEEVALYIEKNRIYQD